MVDLKVMKRKEKVEYIWDYYKIHIIISLIVLICIVSFIHGQVTKINYEFNLTIIGSRIDQDKIDKFEKALTPIVIKNPSKRQSAQIEVMPITSLTSGKESSASQYMQKYAAEIGANVIDVVILDKTDFEAFEKQGGFLKLDNMKGIDLTAIKAEKLEGKPTDGEQGVYGIDLNGNKVLEDLGVDTKDKILCIQATSKQKENSILAVKWILGIK